MNVLLIYPKFPDTFWSFNYALKFIRKKAAYPPLGLAFIGGMAVQRDSAKQIIARCQATGLKVVAGGPLFTAEPDAFEEVDHLVLDEAEITLPSFLKDIKTGNLKKIYWSTTDGYRNAASKLSPAITPGFGHNGKGAGYSRRDCAAGIS